MKEGEQVIQLKPTGYFGGLNLLLNARITLWV